MFIYTFAHDLTLTIPRRRTLERLFGNSDPGCTFFTKKHTSMPKYF